MKEAIVNSAFFGVFISLLAYNIGVYIRNKTRLSFANPLLIAVLLVIGVLSLFKIDYELYNSSAKYLSWLLTPATVCLAIPLYCRLRLLKEHFWAIVLGILSGVIASLVCVLLLALLFRLDHAQYATLLPKTVTTAIGMGISERLGGFPAITTVVIIVTGLVGNIFGEAFLKLIGVRDRMARGVAMGTSSHAFGTSRALEMGEIEGAMSSLSLVVAGLITVVGASIFAQFI